MDTFSVNLIQIIGIIAKKKNTNMCTVGVHAGVAALSHFFLLSITALSGFIWFRFFLLYNKPILKKQIFFT